MALLCQCGRKGRVNSRFWELYGSIRRSLNSPNENGVWEHQRIKVDQLVESSSSEEEFAKSIGVRVQFGSQVGDLRLRNLAYNDLAALSGEHLRIAFDTVSDLTRLGPHEARWQVVRRAFGGHDEAAVRFIDSPSSWAAENLYSNSWEPSGSLPGELKTELKLQAGWAAVRLYFASRSESAKMFCEPRSPVLKLPADSVGVWERKLQLISLNVFDGSWDEARTRLRHLLGSQIPAWARPQVRVETIRLAPLVPHVGETTSWLSLGGVESPTNEELDSELSTALARVAEVTSNPAAAKTRNLLSPEFDDACWAFLGLFVHGKISSTLRSSLAEKLLMLDDEKWLSLPWPNRSIPFIEACLSGIESLQAIHLLIRFVKNDLSDEAVRALEALLLNLPEVDLSEIDLLPLQPHAESFSAAPRLAALIRRRGIYRAVIDGSNVMWGTKQRSAAAKPKLKYLRDVQMQLKAMGYTEIVIFCDARTPHELSEPDKSELAVMQRDNVVTLVHGKEADGEIIKSFMKNPLKSEIVTEDHYKVWLEKGWVQDLGFSEWWPSRKRSFFVEGDNVNFYKSLTEPVDSDR